MSQLFTMNELAELVCDSKSSTELKHLALSIAYQLGVDHAKKAMLPHMRDQASNVVPFEEKIFR
jgi:hypothetical protein